MADNNIDNALSFLDNINFDDIKINDPNDPIEQKPLDKYASFYQLFSFT